MFIGDVYQCITDSLYGGIILLNIEQLNEVETDLVERYDVPLTNKVTPDVLNSITNKYFIVLLAEQCQGF